MAFPSAPKKVPLFSGIYGYPECLGKYDGINVDFISPKKMMGFLLKDDVATHSERHRLFQQETHRDVPWWNTNHFCYSILFKLHVHPNVTALNLMSSPWCLMVVP